MECSSEEELKGSDELEEKLRLWASYRGQTLTRTGTFYKHFFFPSSRVFLKCYLCSRSSTHTVHTNVSVFTFSKGYDVLPESIGASGFS